MTTRYTIPTDADYWGDRATPGVDGEAVAKFVADLLERYCQRNGYDVEIDLVAETQSRNNQSDGDERLIEELQAISDIGTVWQRPFTAADLAEALGISQRQVTKLAQQLKKGKKVGRAWVFGMPEALEFFDRDTKPGPKHTAG